MRTYDEQYRQEVFNLIPEANWIAVGTDGRCHWYSEEPYKYASDWLTSSGIFGRLGRVSLVIDWKDSLFEREWVPKLYENVYISDITSNTFAYGTTWNGIACCEHKLKHNLVFKTWDEAVSRSKQLLGIKELL